MSIKRTCRISRRRLSSDSGTGCFYLRRSCAAMFFWCEPHWRWTGVRSCEPQGMTRYRRSSLRGEPQSVWSVLIRVQATSCGPEGKILPLGSQSYGLAQGPTVGLNAVELYSTKRSLMPDKLTDDREPLPASIL